MSSSVFFSAGEKQTRKEQLSDCLKVDIAAQGSNVFAPIFYNVQAASGITITQSGKD